MWSGREGKSERLPFNILLVIEGLEENRGSILERGGQVNGVSSVPLWAKWCLLRSSRTRKSSSLSVISTVLSSLEVITRSREPGRDPLILGVRIWNASLLTSLLRIFRNRLI